MRLRVGSAANADALEAKVFLWRRGFYASALEFSSRRGKEDPRFLSEDAFDRPGIDLLLLTQEWRERGAWGPSLTGSPAFHLAKVPLLPSPHCLDERRELIQMFRALDVPRIRGNWALVKRGNSGRTAFKTRKGCKKNFFNALIYTSSPGQKTCRNPWEVLLIQSVWESVVTFPMG